MARAELAPGDRIVVKVGTTSLIGPKGELSSERFEALCDGIAALRAAGMAVVLVSSGAIAAGLGPVGLAARPADIPSLQAAAAVGQGRLLARYAGLLSDRGLVAAQLLLTRYDFMHRGQYLNARNTLDRLLGLGAVPIVNENDTVAVDEIRFGDNDRLAALVANLAGATLLVLLTDAHGVHTADPRRVPDAPVFDEIERITPEIERAALGPPSRLGSGGMASKISAAWVATFSGAAVVVARASEPDVLVRVAAGEALGTFFHPSRRRASARRLWIAFAQPPRGAVFVDAGARRAVVTGKRSLLPAGVVGVEGSFEPGDTVDVVEVDGKHNGAKLFARGLVRYAADELETARGRSTGAAGPQDQRSTGTAVRGEVIHRDQLVVLEEEAP